MLISKDWGGHCRVTGFIRDYLGNNYRFCRHRYYTRQTKITQNRQPLCGLPILYIASLPTNQNVNQLATYAKSMTNAVEAPECIFGMANAIFNRYCFVAPDALSSFVRIPGCNKVVRCPHAEPPSSNNMP